MYIIDKNRDYYDYHSGIYGVDKSIVFDRRGSINLPRDAFSFPYYYNYWPKIGDYFYGLLEVGYKQYLLQFKATKIMKRIDVYTETIVDDYDVTLVRAFDEGKHLFEKELSFVRIGVGFSAHTWNRIEGVKYLSDLRYDAETVIPLPILKETKITTVIDSFELWKELSTYISSQKNDKDVDVGNTDRDKIINHGFDVKTSFRHPVK